MRIFRSMGTHLARLCVAIALGASGHAYSADAAFNSATASTALWPASNVIDGVLSTLWTSTAHASASATESITGTYSTTTQINYVKIYPRMVGTTSYGFPENFTVYAYSGGSWQTLRAFTGYPRPYREQYIIIPISSPLNVTAVKIEATKLRTDDVGTYYYFQLGEVLGGYDAAYSKLQYQGNNGNANEVEVQGTGAGAFDSGKMKVWNYDRRNPIMQAPATSSYWGCNGGATTYRNIYGANAVYNSSTDKWAVFFGGYNGACTSPAFDEIWRTGGIDQYSQKYGTEVSFGESNTVSLLSNHLLVVERGDTNNVGNVSVVKLSSGGYRMVYTSYRGSSYTSCWSTSFPYVGVNKPGYSDSSDGLTWSPAAGSTSYLIVVTGYSLPGCVGSVGWGDQTSGQDVNGTNVMYEEGGDWYFYWKGADAKVQVAKNNNGTPSLTHQSGLLVDGAGTLGGNGTTGTQNQYGINDVKKINGKYVWAYHYNGGNLWFSSATSPTPSAISDATKIFDTNTTQPVWGTDTHVVSAGWVTDGTKLKGILYGANPTGPGSPTNAIFARWLQKKVRMTLPSGGALEWMKANGPDKTVMLMVPNYPLETGTVTIYDTDETTVLHTSPSITMRQGDQWKYVP